MAQHNEYQRTPKLPRWKAKMSGFQCMNAIIWIRD